MSSPVSASPAGYSAQYTPLPQAAPSIGGGILNFVEGFYTFCCAVKELFTRNVSLIQPERDEHGNIINRVKSVWEKFVDAIKEFFIGMKYHIVHGAVYVASGICSMISALNKLQVVKLGTALEVVQGVELGTFLVGSVMGLVYHAQTFASACNLPDNAPPEQREDAHRKKTTAILGMLGCIAYLISIAITLFTGMALLAFIIGLLGTFTGFIKMIYDYINPAKAAYQGI